MGKIALLPKEERPREKARKKGIDKLANRELLALLISSGTKGRSALEIGDDLLSLAGGLLGLTSLSLAELTAIKGLGESRALALSSCFELLKRAGEEEIRKKGLSNDPKELFMIYQEHFKNQPSESLYLLGYARNGSLISERRLSYGGENSLSIDESEVLGAALRSGAKRFLLIHNHPSGVSLPSKEDIALTIKLAKEASTLRLTLIDHLIIGKDDYYSFKEAGLLLV